jgi:hypothetical protein
MTTFVANTLYAANDTDAHFRAWCQFIDDVFVSGGWVNTSDTGQIDLSTVARPTGSNQAMGYKIYRMDDALAATYPVYVRVDFGGTGSVSGNPGIWLTVGHGSNGAGTLTGVLLASTSIAAGGNNAATQQTAYASAASGRVGLAMFVTGASLPFWLAIERTKDANLADSSTGVVICYGGGAAGHKSLCAPFTGAIPTAENGLQFLLSTNTSSIYGNDIGIGTVYPMLGPAQPPMLGICVVQSGDFGNYANFQQPLAGTARTYQHCGPNLGNLRAGVTDSNTRLAILYE